MAHKTSGQLGFADAWLGNNPKLNQRLDKLDRLLNWTSFEKLLSVIYASTEGRPSLKPCSYRLGTPFLVMRLRKPLMIASRSVDLQV